MTDIDETRVILAFQHSKNTSQNSISTFFEKKINFWGGFDAVVLVKTFPLMYQILL